MRVTRLASRVAVNEPPHVLTKVRVRPSGDTSIRAPASVAGPSQRPPGGGEQDEDGVAPVVALVAMVDVAVADELDVPLLVAGCTVRDAQADTISPTDATTVITPETRMCC